MKKTLLLLLLLSVQAQAQSLKQVMDAAIRDNPGLKAMRMNVTAKGYAGKSVRGRFLPMVKLDANIMYWNDSNSAVMNLAPIEAKFQALSKFLPPAAQKALQSTGTSMNTGLEIRDRTTGRVQVSVVQPLLGLYGVSAAYKGAKMAKTAATYDYEALKRSIELAVLKAYCGILAAQRLSAGLHAGIRQVRAYEKQIQAFLAAGRIEENALLKVKVQEAELRDTLFTVNKRIALLKARLNTLMGRPQQQEIRVLPIHPPSMTKVSQLTATVQAPDKLPELRAMDARIQAVNWKVHARISRLLPNLNAVFSYDHNEGMGRMMPKDEYFIGLSLSWPIWEWGADYYRLKQARVERAMLQEKRRALKDTLKTAVLAAKLDLKEAVDRLKNSRVKAEEAKDSLHIESLRYQAGKTTTTQLLIAQTQAIRARNQLEVLKIDLFLKFKALQLALGNDLSEN